MGQPQSKQKLDTITQSLNKIRRHLRNGKITANDVERMQMLLSKYSTEVADYRDVKVSDSYTIGQLIEITSEELDGLKQEVNLDQASIATNSFRRSVSKNNSNREKRKSLKSVKSIVDAVHNIQQDVINGRVKVQDFDRLQRDLVNYSQMLGSKKSKKEDVDAAQKLISSVSQELLTKQQEATSPESLRSSLKRKSTNAQTIDIKQMPKIIANNNISSLDDIEQKLEDLQKDIEVAENNKDKRGLHFLLKSIQTLMTDLQMININNDILQEERKTILESNLQKAFNKIDEIKRQLTEENDIKYLAELHMKEKKEKSLQELEEIENSVLEFGKTLNQQNFQNEKNVYNSLKRKLNAVEDIDQDVVLKKKEILEVMLNVENVYTKFEMEERLNRAEQRHFQYKIDVNQFNESINSDTYMKHYQYLQQLKDYVDKIAAVNEKIEQKKEYVLFNINNNMLALEYKAKENENEDKFDGVELRKSTAKSSLRDSAESLLANCQRMSSQEELQDLLSVMNQIRYEVEKKLQEVNVGNEAQLVTIKEKELQPLTTLPPVQDQIEKLQNEVEALQIQIENSRYTKETQLYKDINRKLESCKNQVLELMKTQEDSNKVENLLKYVDNVLLLLDSNTSSRRSTTEDILVDIMSVSTRINDLGVKIQNYTLTTQEYDSIRDSLLEHKQYLKNLRIGPNRTNIIKSRNDILQQIDSYLTILEEYKKNNNNTATNEEKNFNQELRKLKEKVTRYNGTYRNVLYKTIENDLNKCLTKVDQIFKNPDVANQIKQDIENTKMILEQRSVKDQQIKQDVRETGSKELSEVRQNVENVKKELSKVGPLSKEELEQLDARLTLSILALDNIKDFHDSDEKEKLYKDIHYYFDKIQQLMLISRPQSLIDEEQKNSVLTSIENELERIKPQINTFVGTETTEEFLYLDEILNDSTIKLHNLVSDQNSSLYQRKINLLREIDKSCDLLEERAHQCEELEKLEQEVKVMLIKIDSFNGYVGDKDYSYLDEEIIKLKVNLGKLSVNEELIPRRNACIKEVDGCLKKLNETAKSHTDVYEGTLV